MGANNLMKADKHDIRGVLFDLDGTLLDTAPDLAFALNQVRKMHGLPELLLSVVKPFISYGSKKMIKHLLAINENDEDRFNQVRQHLFAIYAKHCQDNTQLFPGMEAVLDIIMREGIAWGIVTNRLTEHTELLLRALNLKYHPQCIVCGDTLAKAKPDPMPILHALTLLDIKPDNCLYVGDAATDIIAGQAAGVRSLVALYGYIGHEEDPYTWDADGYIHHPEDLLNWINQEKTSR